MATKALTPVAPRASRDRVSASKAPGREQDWRHLFNGQDAQAIWQSLFVLIRSSIPDDQSRCEQLTQEAFLYLVACKRMGYYIETGYTNEEIERDLLFYLVG
jgi:hypothetical protein